MCETCGCGVTNTQHAHPEHAHTVKVMQDLMAGNDHVAAHNREHFNAHGVLVINLMSSPGAGKTRLLESTARALNGSLRMMVIEGDLETENDAARIREAGVPAIQITTGNACHLDAEMIHEALHETSLDGIDILFIENVGNLVCPASFDLGQHVNVVLLSVTEGDDKPAKYPVMFRTADLVVLSKCDLLPLLDDFDPVAATRAVEQLGVTAPVIKTGKESLNEWLDWLSRARRLHLANQAQPNTGTGGS